MEVAVSKLFIINSLNMLNFKILPVMLKNSHSPVAPQPVRKDM